MESQLKTVKTKANGDTVITPQDVEIAITDCDLEEGPKKAGDKRRKRTRYIPSCHQDESCADTVIEDAENSPLLDISNDIE